VSIAIERQDHVSHVGQHGQHRTRRQGRLNTLLAGALVAVLALAPVPLASNRPFFWAMWAAVIGGLGVVYLAVLLLRGEALRVPFGRIWLPATLLALLCAFLLFQTVPFAASFVTAAGAVIAARTASLAPGGTWLMLLQVASYGLFFFLMLQVAANRSRARQLLVALFVVVVVHAAYSLAALTLFADSLLFFEKWAYFGFATGSFVNRNSFATFLAFGLVLGVLLSFRSLRDSDLRRPGSAMLYLAATGLILAALVATGSRMGLVAGLAGSSLAALLAVGKGSSQGRRRLLLVLLPVVGALAVLMLYGAGTLERLGSLETDANVRGDLYLQVWQMILARPWLGYGGGAFEVTYPLFHQLPVSPDLVWDKAHSTYLALWAELGMVAGSIPLLIVLVLGIDALRLYLGRRGDWTAPAATVAAIVVAALHSIVDFSLEMEANALFFLAILAIGVARGDRRDRADEEA
jgi:O-antigen ligase